MASPKMLSDSSRRPSQDPCLGGGLRANGRQLLRCASRPKHGSANGRERSRCQHGRLHGEDTRSLLRSPLA